MALNAKKVKSVGGTKQPQLDAGTYPARVVQIIDLGVQAQKPYKGKEKPPINMISISYELLDEFMVDADGNEQEDRPRWVSEIIPFHNLSADKAKSTQRYNALDPKGQYDGDFTQLINEPCMVTLVTNGEYTNVDSIAGMRAKDASKASELKNDPKVFVLEEPDMEVFESLPDWMQDKITDNLEFEGSVLQKALGGKSKAKPKKVEEEPVEDATADDAEEDDWGDDE